MAISGPILGARRQHCTEQQATLLNSKEPEHAAGCTITLTQQQREGRWVWNLQGCCAEPHGAGFCHWVSVSLGIQQRRLRRSPALTAFHLGSSSYSQSVCVRLIDLESSRQEVLSYPSHNFGSELEEASFSGLFWYWLEGTTLRECLSMCVYRQSMHATRSAFDFRPRRRSSWRIHNHTRIREWKKDGKWLRRWSFRI